MTHCEFRSENDRYIKNVLVLGHFCHKYIHRYESAKVGYSIMIFYLQASFFHILSSLHVYINNKNVLSPFTKLIKNANQEKKRIFYTALES
jgi:hypothetical protein